MHTFDVNHKAPYLQIAWRSCPRDCPGKSRDSYTHPTYSCVFPVISEQQQAQTCYTFRCEPESLIDLAEFLKQRVSNTGENTCDSCE
jgi:hypothetical protein